MKHTLPILLAATAAVSTSCRTMPWRDRQPRPVDSALLVHVSEDARQEIAQLQATRAERENELAFARQQVEAEKERLDQAEQGLDVAQAEIKEAESRLEAAEKNFQGDVEGARDNLDATRAHEQWARARIDYHEAQIELAKARADLAREELSLAEARIKFAQAEAVQELDDPHARDIDLAPYRDLLDQAQTQVELAEVDVQSWQNKVAVRETRLSERAEAVPANYRMENIEGVQERGRERARMDQDRLGDQHPPQDMDDWDADDDDDDNN